MGDFAHPNGAREGAPLSEFRLFYNFPSFVCPSACTSTSFHSVCVAPFCTLSGLLMPPYPVVRGRRRKALFSQFLFPFPLFPGIAFFFSPSTSEGLRSFIRTLANAAEPSSFCLQRPCFPTATPNLVTFRGCSTVRSLFQPLPSSRDPRQKKRVRRCLSRFFCSPLTK